MMSFNDDGGKDDTMVYRRRGGVRNWGLKFDHLWMSIDDEGFFLKSSPG